MDGSPPRSDPRPSFRHSWVSRARPIVGLCLWLALTAQAHRLDELLQATLISVGPATVGLEISLTPGIEIARGVISRMDTNRDGVISTAEARDFTAEVLQFVAVTLDGRKLTIEQNETSVSPPGELRAGVGVVRISAMARLGSVPDGEHRLAFENRYLEGGSAYLVNALTPASSAVEILRQDRDERQTTFRLAYALHAAGPEPGYFELRLYTVTSNKLDGVLERFRETVEPVRRKHGLHTVGYWTAPGTTNGGTFAYLMSAANKEELQRQEKEFGADPQFKEGYAASNQKHGKTVDKIAVLPLDVSPDAKFDFAPAKTSRAFDLRIYSVLPGKLDTFRNRWRDHAVPIYERHGLHSVGWWVAEKKDVDGHDQFVCILAAESLDAIQKSIGEFHKDAGWQRVEAETEKDGKLRSGVEAFKLGAADFSALK